MKRLLIVAALAIGVAGTAALLLDRSAPAAGQGLLKPDNAQLVVEGEAIYTQYCASCHGSDLEGEANWRQRKSTGRLPAPPHDETGHTWHHPDEQLFLLTKLGPEALIGGGYESDMPGYADTLSDREIVAVLSYIKSTWPDEVRQRHDQINQRSQ